MIFNSTASGSVTFSASLGREIRGRAFPAHSDGTPPRVAFDPFDDGPRLVTFLACYPRIDASARRVREIRASS